MSWTSNLHLRFCTVSLSDQHVSNALHGNLRCQGMFLLPEPARTSSMACAYTGCVLPQVVGKQSQRCMQKLLSSFAPGAFKTRFGIIVPSSASDFRLLPPRLYSYLRRKQWCLVCRTWGQQYYLIWLPLFWYLLSQQGFFATSLNPGCSVRGQIGFWEFVLCLGDVWKFGDLVTLKPRTSKSRTLKTKCSKWNQYRQRLA